MMKVICRPARNINWLQIRMARAGLALSIRELAEMSGLNKATIVRIEAGYRSRPATLKAIRRSLENAGADFLRYEGQEGIVVGITDIPKSVSDTVREAEGD